MDSSPSHGQMSARKQALWLGKWYAPLFKNGLKYTYRDTFWPNDMGLKQQVSGYSLGKSCDGNFFLLDWSCSIVPQLVSHMGFKPRTRHVGSYQSLCSESWFTR